MIFIKRLIWDEWNVAHIAKHQVIPQEVEEACHGLPQMEEGKKGRFRLVGPTHTGRMLAAFLDPEREEGAYYPVTARDASRKERREYRQWKAKGGEAA